MKKLLKRGLKIAAYTALALVTVVVGLVLWDRPPASVREYYSLRQEWDVENMRRDNTLEEWTAIQLQFAERCLKLAEKYPNTAAELSALMLADKQASDTAPGQQALERLRPRIASVELEQLRKAVCWYGQSTMSPRSTPDFLNRIKQHLDHPQTPLMLAIAAAALASGSESSQPPEHFGEVADLIVSRFIESPDIYNFNEVLGPGYSCPRWAPQFETHVKRILDVNKNYYVRCSAKMTLAQIAQASTSRQSEAEEMYRDFLEEYEDDEDPLFQNVVQHKCRNAKQQLEAMQFASIGQPAPEITGIDLGGQSMTLSEFRGKVVLMTFWATWCAPCMKLVPHERELAERYAGQPFAIVGVNADETLADAVQAVAEKKISWRSFRDKRDGAKEISEEWKALFPTVYLIDHNGIVRQRFSGSPNLELMRESVEELVVAAKTK